LCLWIGFQLLYNLIELCFTFGGFSEQVLLSEDVMRRVR
jgi:hypothetical protein